VRISITDQANELVVLREIIPWQKITDRLTPFYNDAKGRMGVSLRTVIALLIVGKLRLLSDRKVVSRVIENRYLQYFCNVPDEKLKTFIHHSSLSKIRRRLGEDGMAVIESEISEMLRSAGVMKGDRMLADSTVLPGNIAYPTDIGLICDAFGKMSQFAKHHGIPLWWDDKEVRELRREHNMNRERGRTSEYFFEFAMIFLSALLIFGKKVADLVASDSEKEKAGELLTLLTRLNEQNGQKIAGERHVRDRIVSLSDPDMRPIKKGKSHPDCEFGTTAQITFTREGFMVTVENFIGNPGDKKIFSGTYDLFTERTGSFPVAVVTDGGYRSRSNTENLPPETGTVFMGRSSDVCEEERDFCRSARSATEGFIAVAKNLRGFGRSLYRGLRGHRIWSLLCQTAYNLKKFLLLWFTDEISEDSMVRLGIG
jgi:hypothetical protein